MKEREGRVFLFQVLLLHSSECISPGLTDIALVAANALDLVNDVCSFPRFQLLFRF